MFPGKTLYPYSSTFYPPLYLNNPSNKLYSTLMVSVWTLSLCTKVAIAPSAYPGFLGIAIELKSKFFSAETPNNMGKLRKAKGFVSWKNTIHFLP